MPANSACCGTIDATKPSVNRLDHRVVGLVGGARAVGAETGDRHADQARVARGQVGIHQTQALHHAGAEVVDQHVGTGDQRGQYRPGGRRLQIKRDTALAAVGGDEGR